MKVADSVMRRRVKAFCGSDLLIAIFVTVHAENPHRMIRWGGAAMGAAMSCASEALPIIVESRLTDDRRRRPSDGPEHAAFAHLFEILSLNRLIQW